MAIFRMYFFLKSDVSVFYFSHKKDAEKTVSVIEAKKKMKKSNNKGKIFSKKWLTILKKSIFFVKKIYSKKEWLC